MTKGIISEIRNRKIFEKKVVNNWWTQLIALLKQNFEITRALFEKYKVDWKLFLNKHWLLN